MVVHPAPKLRPGRDDWDDELLREGSPLTVVWILVIVIMLIGAEIVLTPQLVRDDPAPLSRDHSHHSFGARNEANQ